jgi:hypothetical protein
MKPTVRLFVLFLLAALLLSACSGANANRDMAEIYSLALDAYMPLDSGLNHDMEYIAIDMSNFENVDEAGKKEILKYFEKYKVEVMDATYEELKERGLYDPEGLYLYGILLRVEKTDISRSKVVIEGSKYRSGLGAIGTRVTVKYKNKRWEVTKVDETWIS